MFSCFCYFIPAYTPWIVLVVALWGGQELVEYKIKRYNTERFITKGKDKMDKAEKIAEKIHSQLYRNKGQQIEIKIITEALKEYAGEAVKKYKALEGGAVDDEEIKTAKKEKEHV